MRLTDLDGEELGREGDRQAHRPPLADALAAVLDIEPDLLVCRPELAPVLLEAPSAARVL